MCLSPVVANADRDRVLVHWDKDRVTPLGMFIQKVQSSVTGRKKNYYSLGEWRSLSSFSVSSIV